MKHAILLAVTVLIGGMNIPTTVFAQESCGSIIEYYDYGEGPVIDSETPIEDCGNPFGIAEVDPALVVTYGETVLEGGSTYAFLDGVTHPWNITGYTSEYAEGVLYLHNGSDYILKQHIPNGESYRFTEAGTYTFVVSEMYSPVMTRGGTFERLRELLIPTALASYIGPALAVTFTVTEPTAEPVGISNILFLPGIQASRLYREGLFGTEDQVWPPSANFGQDVRDLSMTNEGLSENVIYTRDVIDSSLGVGSVYGGFLNFLEGLKTAPLPMKEYTAFAYDWRYDVFDIVESGAPYPDQELKNLVDEVVRLSVDSFTDKVTIVAHSNGGLLAKALVAELERRGISNKVDRVVFIGTPQLGTPKAIGTILHGYDQSDDLGGVFIDADVAREVINNMPGAYGLLPSEEYFAKSTEPLISFEGTSATGEYRLSYGSTIDSFDEYKNFLLGVENATDRVLDGAISTPAKANEAILENALKNHKDELDEWVAPSGIEVIEVVGTGLPTMRGVAYRSIIEGEDCISTGGPAVCTPRLILKPYAQLTKYGDQTVIQMSASAYDGIKKTFFFDLSGFKKDYPKSKYKHFNLTEISQIQDLIEKIVYATSTGEISYVSETPLAFDDSYDIEMIDSPVRMLAMDRDGNETGVKIVDGERTTVADIPGSQYFEFGDTKYLVIPKDIEHTTTLNGEEDGKYALTVASLGSDNTQTIEHKFENAIVTPLMVATYEKNDGEYSTVTTDTNGDGIIDVETTIDGVVIENEVTYHMLKEEIHNLHLSRVHEKVLLTLVRQAERLSNHPYDSHHWKERAEEKILTVVKKQLERYKKMRIITNEQYQKLGKIIIDLIEK